MVRTAGLETTVTTQQAYKILIYIDKSRLTIWKL